MFVYNRPVWQSSLLENLGVGHAFSTREGGVSTLDHTRSMNTGFYRGDSDDTVRENIRLLCSYGGVSENVVGSPQIHSDEIRVVTEENGGEGITRDVPYPCDGFVTDRRGVSLLIRVADCAPVLLCGIRGDGGLIVGAVHAGWKGTALGIAPKAVGMLFEMGAERVVAAIGPCIHDCCFNVWEERRDAVVSLRGPEFAGRHIKERNGELFADIAGMNRELLLEAGAAEVDVLSECTQCKPFLYHSHRATGGNRGTMGAVIGIK
ncbi:MAG: laccase domain-containing protein [Clostridia bacterium]|nr:laccase domain-containing protein [Clostridia bacterium]